MHVLTTTHTHTKNDDFNQAIALFPQLPRKVAAITVAQNPKRFQNVHSLLGWYEHDLQTDVQLVDLLTQVGVFADSNPCLICGGDMRKVKEGEHWFWICRSRVNGVKCQKKKKSISTD